MEDLQGERVREKNGFQSAGNPVYIYIIISTLTPSSSLSLSFWGLFKKKKKNRGKRQTREGFRRLLVEVCCCCFVLLSPFLIFLKVLPGLARMSPFLKTPANTSNPFSTSLSLPCNAFFEWGLSDLLASSPRLACSKRKARRKKKKSKEKKRKKKPS